MFPPLSSLSFINYLNTAEIFTCRRSVSWTGLAETKTVTVSYGWSYFLSCISPYNWVQGAVCLFINATYTPEQVDGYDDSDYINGCHVTILSHSFTNSQLCEILHHTSSTDPNLNWKKKWKHRKSQTIQNLHFVLIYIMKWLKRSRLLFAGFASIWRDQWARAMFLRYFLRKDLVTNNCVSFSSTMLPRATSRLSRLSV